MSKKILPIMIIALAAISAGLLLGQYKAMKDSQIEVPLEHMTSFGLYAIAQSENDGDLELKGSDGQNYYLITPPIVSGQDIKSAYWEPDNTGRTVLTIEINSQATQALSEFTASHIGEEIAFVFKDHVLSAPRIMDQISQSRFTLAGDYESLDLPSYPGAFALDLNATR